MSNGRQAAPPVCVQVWDLLSQGNKSNKRPDPQCNKSNKRRDPHRGAGCRGLTSYNDRGSRVSYRTPAPTYRHKTHSNASLSSPSRPNSTQSIPPLPKPLRSHKVNNWGSPRTSTYNTILTFLLMPFSLCY